MAGQAWISARGLAFLFTLSAAVVVVVGFARLMTGRLPFTRLNLWGLEADLNTAQDEQIAAFQERLSAVENIQLDLLQANRHTAEALLKLEGEHVKRDSKGPRALGEGGAEHPAD